MPRLVSMSFRGLKGTGSLGTAPATASAAGAKAARGSAMGLARDSTRVVLPANTREGRDMSASRRNRFLQEVVGPYFTACLVAWTTYLFPPW